MGRNQSVSSQPTSVSSPYFFLLYGRLFHFSRQNPWYFSVLLFRFIPRTTFRNRRTSHGNGTTLRWTNRQLQLTTLRKAFAPSFRRRWISSQLRASLKCFLWDVRLFRNVCFNNAAWTVTAVLYKPYLILTTGTKMKEFLFCYIDGRNRIIKRLNEMV